MSRLRIVLPALVAAGLHLTVLASGPTRPRFFPDDPIWKDDDCAFDASGMKTLEASDMYDFIENTFMGPGDRRDTPAVNVNTVDEVPDSNWFINRIGRRPMPIPEIVRGPDRLDTVEVQDWPIVRDKGEGRQPGYRVVDPSGQLWQIEFDPPSYPEMATGAEVIGTAFYHAFGYHVVDVYVVEFDPEKLRIAENATSRDVKTGKRRPMTRADVDAVLAQAARRPSGRVRALASRFAEGQFVGNFRYYGTRADDPNDIHPHEHRRELRGARVFGAWLNHDDSRGLNSLSMLQKTDGKACVKHYMFDYGSIMGSGTIFAERPRGGNEYIFELKPGLLTLLTLGLYAKPWIRIDYPEAPPAVGRFEGDAFEAEHWKPEYPNTAFDNMRPEDAFWGAHIVSRFSNEAVRAVVEKAQYTDPAATDYLTKVLIKRRDKVLRTWLNGVTPLVDPRIENGKLVLRNAAVDAGVATPAERYRMEWFTFDNITGSSTPVGPPDETAGQTTHGSAPVAGEVSARIPEGLAGPFAGVRITGIHRDHPGWSTHPATFYFRRSAKASQPGGEEAAGWEAVGIQRFP